MPLTCLRPAAGHGAERLRVRPNVLPHLIERLRLQRQEQAPSVMTFCTVCVWHEEFYNASIRRLVFNLVRSRRNRRPLPV